MAKLSRSRIKLLGILAAVIVLVVLVALLLPQFYVAFAGGFISRGELVVRQRHVQFAYELQLRGRSPVDPDFARKMQKEILLQMIAERLLMQEAKQELLPSREEQQAYVQDVVSFITREFFGGSSEALGARLAKASLTLAELDRYLAETLVVYKLREARLKEIVITEAEIKAHFDARRAEYNLPEMIRLRHIVVKERPLAENIWRQLQRGSDFVALAQEHTVDIVSRPLGGDLNWRRRGEFAEAFEVAAWSLATVGSISPVVKTDMGYHVIKLEGKLPPRERSLVEVQDAVRARLLEEREAALWEAYVSELRRQVLVLVFLR
ncbi:MAG: Foldase protein PrsA 2 [Firmicutes bacterium]|nr:Foldase protein PrsA 2 [Bacillota bacterium]